VPGENERAAGTRRARGASELSYPEEVSMSEINWLTDFEQAGRRARESNKLVLLDFFSPT
jgi:hypothetical protein